MLTFGRTCLPTIIESLLAATSATLAFSGRYAWLVHIRRMTSVGNQTSSSISQDSKWHKLICFCWQDSTVEAAVERLHSSCCLQPCLFRTGNRFYMKCDNTEQSYATDQRQLLHWGSRVLVFFSFWVFEVNYPAPLRIFYQFIERLVSVGHYLFMSLPSRSVGHLQYHWPRYLTHSSVIPPRDSPQW